LDSADKGEFVSSIVYEICFDIGLYSKVSRMLKGKSKILDQIFLEKVTLKVAMPEETDLKFLEDGTCGQCKITQISREFFDYGTSLQY